MRIGIIGATGWLGSALGRRLLETGIAMPEDVTLLNKSGPRDDYFGHSGLRWADGARDLVARADVIVLSVRPADYEGLDFHAENKLVLSFMAGVGSNVLRSASGRLVRVMPNAAAEIGRSYSPWWADGTVTGQDKSAVRRILSAIGTSDELADEGQIDLMSAVPGSGAAYPALMAKAMADFLMARGVGSRIAWRSAEAVVCGGAQLLSGRIETSPAMLETYLDYAGITAKGLTAAESAGFSAAVEAALDAATRAAQGPD